MSPPNKNRSRRGGQNERTRLLRRLLDDGGLKLETFYANFGERPRVTAGRLRRELDGDHALRVIINARDCSPQPSAEYLQDLLLSLFSPRLKTPPIVHYRLLTAGGETSAQAVIARLGLLGEGGPQLQRSPLSSPCKLSRKTKYEDAQAADASALAYAAHHNNAIAHTSYHCSSCGWYHLTSQLS